MGYDTPAKLEIELVAEVKKITADIPEENTAVYDAELLVSTDGGTTWAKATEENFPDDGLTLTLPYPDGTDSSFRFTVVHMFTSSFGGKTPGDIETFGPDEVQNTENGIRFTVTGLSPISVGWTAPVAPEPVVPTQPGGSSGGSSHTKRESGTTATYDISVRNPAHGTVSANRTKASEGSTVTLTVTPYSGYELDFLTVTDSKGNDIRVTGKDSRFTFTMPARAVTVEAGFVEIVAEDSHFAECPSRAFYDLNTTKWYHEAVDFVLNNGLMNGTNAGFAPNAQLSRAMLAQILWNHAGKPSATVRSIFADVPADEWYSGAVDWAAAQGIVSGYSDGRFAPNDSITREQLAVMLWRYAGSPAANQPLAFSDAGSAGKYALDALQWAVANGILSGKGGNRLDPTGSATRAEAAQMLYNFIK